MRFKKGTVVSAKGNKTIIVAVVEQKKHPKYRKFQRSTRRFHAHDEENRHQEGDAVVIREVRPLSKMKRWLVIPEASVSKWQERARQEGENRAAREKEIAEKTLARLRTPANSAKKSSSAKPATSAKSKKSTAKSPSLKK
jgi:small subunit ribosomal protein S17